MTPVSALALVDSPETAGQDQELEVQHFVTSVSVQVVDIATCQQAVDLRTDIKGRQAKVLAWFKPLKDAAYKAHKALTGREAEVLAPLNQLDASLRTSIQTWTDQQERARRDEERRIAEERRRDDEARAAQEAAALERLGRHAEASAIVAEAIAAPAPVVVLPTIKTQVVGLKTRREWKWRYVNNDPAKALARMPREYLCIDEKKINAVVRGLQGATSIPGIEVYPEDVPVR